MTIKNFIKKWHGKGVEDYGGIVSPEFVQFTKDFRAALNGICKAINANLVSYSKGHYDLSAFIERDDRYVYLSFSVPRGEFPVNLDAHDPMRGFLVRTARHAKDFTGGMNHFCSAIDLENNIDRLLNE